MMIPKGKKIVVFCPGNLVTGGPELLHQLVDALVNLGRDAAICYTPIHRKFECPQPYRKYNAPQANASEADGAVVIIPEVSTAMVRQFKNSHIVIWWMSVDNYFGMSRESFVLDAIQRLKTLLRGRIPLFKIKNFYHLAQSEYARSFLDAKGIKAQMLTDYLGEEHMEPRDSQQREDLILYNPKKGIRYTRMLEEALPEFKFLPLIDMTPTEISDCCNRAKVYIDFGHHPGKDRMPREAVIAGCCLITGLRGSALFDEDVYIPKKYKVSESSANFVHDFREVITGIFEDFSEKTMDFDEYRERIKSERSVFLNQVSNIF